MHILVNNSGATWGAPYTDFPEANGWDKILALNVKSLFYRKSSTILTVIKLLTIYYCSDGLVGSSAIILAYDR